MDDAILEFTLLVIRSGGSFQEDTIIITVKAGPNDAPAANAGVDQIVAEGVIVTLDGRDSSDPEDEILSYAWTQTSGPDVALSGADSSTPSFTVPIGLSPGSVFKFRLVVTDARLLASSANTVSITLIDFDPDISASVSTLIAIAGRAIPPVTIDSSAGGSVVRYAIVPPIGNNLAFDTTTGTISGTPDAVADAVSYTITATNNLGSDMVTVAITVTDVLTAHAGPDQTVAEGATIRLDGSASAFPTGATPGYIWEQISGPMVRILANAVSQTFTAPVGLTADVELVFELTVSARNYFSTDRVTITVSDTTIGGGTNTVTPDPEEPPIVIDPLQLSVERLTVVLGETREVTISGGVPPFVAAFVSGDFAATRLMIVDGMTLRVTGVVTGQARLRIRDSRRTVFAYLQVRVNAPPVLNPEADDGSATEAVFRGGASSDGGNNYFKDGAFSVGEALDIVFVITPRASDVGEQANVVIAARMRSDPETVWLLTESGLVPYDGETLVSFKEDLTLEVNNFINPTPEPITLTVAEVGDWELFVGYQLANGELFYHTEPLRIEVME